MLCACSRGVPESAGGGLPPAARLELQQQLTISDSGIWFSRQAYI